MQYVWYLLFNRAEFLEAGIPQREIRAQLEGRGEGIFLVNNAVGISVAYEGVLLPIGFEDKNPYVRDEFALYFDAGTEDVYFGFAVSEDV